MKRLLSILLALALMFSLFACGTQPSGSASTAPETPKASGSTSEPYKIVFAFPEFAGNVGDAKLVSEAMSKITLEKINCTVELMPLGIAAYMQQLPLMISGKEKLDVVWAANFTSMVSQGQLTPITKYMDTTLANAKSTIGDTYIKACYFGKDIYGLPSMHEFAADHGIVMRTDLVKKYNIDVKAIKSWEDIEPILDKIKKSEPNIIPLTAYSNMYSVIQPIFDSTWPWSDGFGDVYFDGNDGKVVNRYESNEYKYWCNKANDWYKKGYIFSDVATTQENGQTLMKAGRLFSYLALGKPGFEEQEQMIAGCDLTYVPITGPVSPTSMVNGLQLGIPSTCTNVDKATEFMNLLYTNKDLMTLLVNGIKDKHYTVDAKGFAVPTDSKGWQTNSWQQGNNFLSLLWNYDPPTKWEDTIKFNDQARRALDYGLMYDLSSVGTEFAACFAVLQQYRAALENGTVSTDTMLAEFIGKLKDAGLQKIIDVKQAQLDAYLGR